MTTVHLVTHISPDGDAIGAVFGARALLAAWRDAAVVHLWGPRPRWFDAVHAMLGAPPWTDAMVPAGGVPVWLLDAPNAARCGAGNVPDDAVVHWHIDHHPEDEAPPAAVSIIDPAASSACELLARYAIDAPPRVDAEAASWLYLGMRTDTLSFSTPATGARTHEVVAALIARGARHADIAALLHKGLTRDLLAFQVEVTREAEYYGDTVILVAEAWQRRRHDVNTNDAKSVLGLASQVEGVRLVVLLIEADDGAVLVSARSPGSDRARRLAVALGGGGHDAAAGARLTGTGTGTDAVLGRVRQWLYTEDSNA